MLGWNRLVTPGHVRAARLRRATPLFVTVSVASALAGTSIPSLFWPILIRPSDVLHSVHEAQAAGSDIRNAVARTFATMPPPAGDPAGIPNAREIRSVVERISAALAAGRDLPNDIRLQPVTPEEVRRGNWPPGRIGVIRGEDTVLLTAVVAYAEPAASAATGGQRHMLRWMGILRNTSKGWEPWAIRHDNFFGPAGSRYVEPQQITGTLARLLEVNGA